ncbi:hypothetical protein R3P38DRAFT_1697477 [Favolaschia claudopus]|uniref:Uncharacterized protein n=1 Tax=Favolaschia claudopus TaxID=2862362 RepID=A0AAW0ACJ0_9AGAR
MKMVIWSLLPASVGALHPRKSIQQSVSATHQTSSHQGNVKKVMGDFRKVGRPKRESQPNFRGIKLRPVVQKTSGKNWWMAEGIHSSSEPK